jgi:hypothetical protein
MVFMGVVSLMIGNRWSVEPGLLRKNKASAPAMHGLNQPDPYLPWPRQFFCDAQRGIPTTMW